MRQCNVPGGQQVPTGHGGRYSLLDGEPWRILFAAEPLGPGIKGLGTTGECTATVARGGVARRAPRSSGTV